MKQVIELKNISTQRRKGKQKVFNALLCVSALGCCVTNFSTTFYYIGSNDYGQFGVQLIQAL